MDVEHLIKELPDPDAAERFLSTFEDQDRAQVTKLRKNDGLLSDVLTLAAYSPLLSTTLLQNPEYLWWLNRKRKSPSVRTKDDLLEALGRFSLTHSQLDLHTQLARFRRRELMRIFLSDIRRLATIAEVTEDISNLADTILETALRAARQEMDNRFGRPEVVDDKGRKSAAGFCIVSLGKLGSRELNYSSDIDLLFLYSAEGETSGRGTRGAVTNREYFVKLSETIVRLIGEQKGEGAAYRVDMRLRPHGRVGPLAISVDDAVRYYTSEGHAWERQVLIRSRASAGDTEIYKVFFERVENAVFVSHSDAERNSAIRDALASVRRSKQLIDREQRSDRGFNVKLGRGGIREIEFIAQALQLAYGGEDRWLRAPHTLISLSRLADRELISESELTELFNAYDFLRRLEHILQMENGLQTHIVPDEPARRGLIARRMHSKSIDSFENELATHAENVSRVFARVFGTEEQDRVDSLEAEAAESPEKVASVESITTQQNRAGNPTPFPRRYLEELTDSISSARDFRTRLGALRRRWAQLIADISDADRRGDIDIKTAKHEQTALAEASVEVALDITRPELAAKYKTTVDHLDLAVMGLGKLGGGAIDYESDLDLVLVYDGDAAVPAGKTAVEFYSRAAEIFVTTLSSITRDGHLYRVDLRLRPYGKNGTSTISSVAFADYMRETADMWEWLAYVKIRGVGGDIELARRVEADIRQIIYDRAANASAEELAAETRRVRLRLEKERSRRRSKDVDIKYGPGGMLDVYFAMRFLQLRDNIPDSAEDRSTRNMLVVLCDKGSLSPADYDSLFAGYCFLSTLDHELRLAVGRTTRLPEANVKALDAIASRMKLSSAAELIEELTVHRLNIRAAFDSVVR